MKSFVRRPLVCSRVQYPFCPLVLTVDFPLVIRRVTIGLTNFRSVSPRLRRLIHKGGPDIDPCVEDHVSYPFLMLPPFPGEIASMGDPWNERSIDPIIELSIRTINQVVELSGGSHQILDRVIRHVPLTRSPIRTIGHPADRSGGSMRISSVEAPKIHSDSGDTRRAAPPFRPTLRRVFWDTFWVVMVILRCVRMIPMPLDVLPYIGAEWVLIHPLANGNRSSVTALPYTSSSQATTVHQLECQLTGPPSWVSTRSVHRARLSCRSAHLAELDSHAAGLAHLAELASSSSLSSSPSWFSSNVLSRPFRLSLLVRFLGLDYAIPNLSMIISPRSLDYPDVV
ncbi:hypothetical protein ISN44_As06g037040 [Arabidopsis suecica]|uniref:Uncharacterized protein n=1 Tax=Arabidopsis suecica TaxID=45249 RepID=A0A8T2CML5_ARASU|nr:hypothetical protein ISN44_As06g037040 [Arabidopsis suecica]